MPAQNLLFACSLKLGYNKLIKNSESISEFKEENIWSNNPPLNDWNKSAPFVVYYLPLMLDLTCFSNVADIFYYACTLVWFRQRNVVFNLQAICANAAGKGWPKAFFFYCTVKGLFWTENGFLCKLWCFYGVFRPSTTFSDTFSWWGRWKLHVFNPHMYAARKFPKVGVIKTSKDPN